MGIELNTYFNLEVIEIDIFSDGFFPSMNVVYLSICLDLVWFPLSAFFFPFLVFEILICIFLQYFNTCLQCKWSNQASSISTLLSCLHILRLPVPLFSFFTHYWEVGSPSCAVGHSELTAWIWLCLFYPLHPLDLIFSQPLGLTTTQIMSL